IARIAEGRRDVDRIERSIRPVTELEDARSDDDGVTGRFVADDMALRPRDDLAAAWDMGHQRDEVAHRPGRDEQAGFLAEELGRSLLEGVDRRVLAPDVIADLGSGHRP